MHGTEMVTSIVAVISVFGTIFGISYMYLTARNRERLAMIDKGVNADIFKTAPNRLNVLKWALLIIGGGIGLLFGNILAAADVMSEEAAIFSMIFIFGGIGLLTFYFLAKIKDEERHNIED